MIHSQRGSALILVLWCVLILSICILAAARLVDWGISNQRLESRRFDAKQLALTGIAYACDSRIEKTDRLLKQKWTDKKQLHVLIGSEGGRININHLLTREDYTLLADLFKLWGMSDRDSIALTDCLKDWVDADDLRSLHGFERNDLEKYSCYVPANRFFLSVAEMRGVKNFALLERLKPNWAEFFSILSGVRLDIQEVSADLLIAFGKLTGPQAESFIAYRNGLDREPNTPDDVQLESLENLSTIIRLSDLQRELIARNFQIGGSPVRITSIGRVGEIQYTITAVVAAQGKEFLWWEEG